MLCIVFTTGLFTRKYRANRTITKQHFALPLYREKKQNIICLSGYRMIFPESLYVNIQSDNLLSNY